MFKKISNIIIVSSTLVIYINRCELNRKLNPFRPIHWKVQLFMHLQSISDGQFLINLKFSFASVNPIDSNQRASIQYTTHLFIFWMQQPVLFRWSILTPSSGLSCNWIHHQICITRFVYSRDEKKIVLREIGT